MEEPTDSTQSESHRPAPSPPLHPYSTLVDISSTDRDFVVELDRSNVSRARVSIIDRIACKSANFCFGLDPLLIVCRILA